MQQPLTIVLDHRPGGIVADIGGMDQEDHLEALALRDSAIKDLVIAVAGGCTDELAAGEGITVDSHLPGGCLARLRGDLGAGGDQAWV